MNARRSAEISAVLLLLVAGTSARADWPTYRADAERSGVSQAPLPYTLAKCWVRRDPAPQPAWPPPAERDYWHRHGLRARVTFDRAYQPVVAGGRLLFGSSADHHVYCLEVETGAESWSYATEGPVRLAPTVSGERVLVTSDDGAVHCLDLRTGKRLWRTRVAPGARRVANNGRLISAWPVRTDALVAGSRVHVGVGVFPAWGTYHRELDLESGAIVGGSRLTASPQGYLVRKQGKLYVPSGRAPAVPLLPDERRARATPKKDERESPVFARISVGEQSVEGREGEWLRRGPDGEIVSRHPVTGRVYGLAASGGRLFVSTDRGELLCYGEPASQRLGEESPPRRPAKVEFDLDATWPLRDSASSGYALVYGDPRGEWTSAIGSRLPGWTVVGIARDERIAAAMRQRIVGTAPYGRVSVQTASESEGLPYADGLANLSIVVDASSVSPEEAMRCVRPFGGELFVRAERATEEWKSAIANWGKGPPRDATLATRDWRRWERGALLGAGSWTHLYGGPGNSASSEDRRVGSQVELQWFGEPGPRSMVDRHHRASAPLVDRGELFVIGDEFLGAYDAFNGTKRWERRVEGTRRVGVGRDCGNAALGDRLYVAIASACHAIDRKSGELLRRYSVPQGASESTPELDWGFVAWDASWLVGSSVPRGATRRNKSVEAIDEIYNDSQALVVGTAVFGHSTDAASDERSGWTVKARRGGVLHSTLSVALGRVFWVESLVPATRSGGRFPLARLLEEGSELVCASASSGEILWRRASGAEACRHALYSMVANPGGEATVVLCGSLNRDGHVVFRLSAFDAETGDALWTREQRQAAKAGGNHGEKDLHPVIVGSRIYLEPRAYDLRSGEPAQDWRWPLGDASRRGCGAVSASSRSLYFRHGTTAAVDFETQTLRSMTQATRPGCWINVIPASGLLVMPEGSSGCRCDFPVQTTLVAAPVTDGKAED